MSHTLTAFEVKPSMIKEPIHKERVQILWRMPTFGDELHNRQDMLQRPDEPTSEHLQSLINSVAELVPSMNKEMLSTKFDSQDHRSNSKSFQDTLGEMEHGYLEDVHDTVDLYEGGACVYDPYFIYGFGRFGEMEFENPFDLDDLWRVHEIEHLPLDEDDPYHGHGEHDFGDEFMHQDEFFNDPMYEQMDDFMDLGASDFDYDMHEDFVEGAYDDVQDVELVDMWDHDAGEL
jgi:hypothetical protein